MIHDIAAAVALDNLPIGSLVAVAEVELDRTASVYLLEHVNRGGQKLWKNLTTDLTFTQSTEVATRYDDMVVCALGPRTQGSGS